MRIGEYPPSTVIEESLGASTALSGNGAEDELQPVPETELGALSALGFSKPLVARMVAQARRHGTSVENELLRSGQVEEEAYYGAIARLLRLPFIPSIDPASVADALALDSQLQRPTMLRIAHRHRAPQTAIVPEAARLADIAAALATMPLLGRDLAITTPSAIRNAVWQTGAARRARQATYELFERRPHLSARIVLAGHQGFYAGLMIALLVCVLALRPIETLPLLHVTLSLTYLACLVLRLAALMRKIREPPKQAAQAQPAGPMPAIR
jgi:uncharacterized membrane protein